MIQKQDFKKISQNLWEIPKEFSPEMRTPARIYASEEMLTKILEDRSVNQLINTASLPGIEKHSMAMPDIHEGYGFPIGGVAGIDTKTGVISPGGVGYDINCGMRILLSPLQEKEITKYIEKLSQEIQESVPSGLGKGRKTKTDISFLNKILQKGSQALVEKGYGDQEDIENCESKGRMESADPSTVSDRAKQRGRDQIGTLGSGNHFIEIQKVEKIFDEQAAKEFGIFQNQVAVMFHTGSRGLGHQVATDYIKEMMKAMNKYKIQLPDRELACAPFNSPEGQRYFSAMSAAANYAWANRQMIAYHIKKSWEKTIGKEKPTPLYDVAHNIAKKENHNNKELIVHRKGATRAFPPNHPEIPEKYKKKGQPVLIPGSMGTGSYILKGTEQGKESWHSTCHGAGRAMSRKQAIKTISGQEIIRELKGKGILIKSKSNKGVAEEAPQAYKDIDQVVEIVHQANLSKKVAKLIPLAVIKGD
ncbi:MAG: RNA-splicing ligase RtcB [Candidatus Portnoybacteria bacterium]|nr:RNA-splicing ligase RtcB [Candidatus Portnoybacteria bacterium]